MVRSGRERIAAELVDALNEGRTADNVVAGSMFTMGWRCSAGHIYWTTPHARKAGHRCHFCTRQTVHQTTSLAATRPDIAALWHGELNGDLTPADVLAGSCAKAWWRCENGCAYEGTIAARVKGKGCRFCANREVNPANCMRATSPQLSAEFNPDKNGSLTPDTVIAGTNRRLWWRCERGHEWQASGSNRERGTGCPFCSNRRVLAGFNDMATTRPDLAAEFHDSLNTCTPRDVVAGTSRRLWWKCKRGHEWRASGDNRSKGSKCCFCSHRALHADNSLAATRADLVASWHPSLNGAMTPHDVIAGTKRQIFWLCSRGHTWRTSGDLRTRGATHVLSVGRSGARK